MERKNFIKGLGLAGAGTLFATRSFSSNAAEPDTPLSCTLIPAETRGPYPLPSATNVSAVTRSDIRESKTGIALQLTILVQNLDCTPVPGARVDIWHCDKDGYYSGYNSQPGYLGTQNNAGTTFLRGSQTTDNNGQVLFTTVYPGWYTGRVTHIHAEIYLADTLMRTSQFAFPDALNTAVYTGSSFYVPHGINSITNSNDNVFSDGVSQQLLNITGNLTEGYVADHTFTINYTVVPLKLISLNAGIENNRPVLWWATENEISAGFFTIERSCNGKDFFWVGNLVATNLPGVNQYSFADNVAANQNFYYRLKMMNVNGSFTYSSIILLKAKANSSLSVYPNPAKDKVILTYPLADNNSYAEVLSMDGKTIAYTRLPSGSSTTTINTGILAKGIYLLVFTGSGQKQVTKFIKQ